MDVSTEEHDFSELLEVLEKQEIESPNGIPPDGVYLKMMALYLLENEVIYAKLLWKRIPSSVKASNPELSRLWEVGRLMFQRRRDEVAKRLQEEEWSSHVVAIMEALQERYRKRTLKLISNAYSSMRIEEVGRLLNQPLETVPDRCRELGWTPERGTVLPTAVASDKEENIPSGKLLGRLAMYVSFIENGL